jgi:hypothetical protein
MTPEQEIKSLRELANDLTKILLREGDVQGAIQRQAFRMMTEMTMNNRQLFDELGFKGDHDDKVHKALLELKALRDALGGIAACGCLYEDRGCFAEGRYRVCTPCVAGKALGKPE